MADFKSKPHDANHPLLDPGDDWRHGNSLGDIATRFVSYGNYAGPGNRILSENSAYVAAQKAKNPYYDDTTDPRFANDPRYAPVDAIDAAARVHDSGYNRHLGAGNSEFDWSGLNAVAGDDRKLASTVRAELAQNGDEYSGRARAYAQRMEGFFAGRSDGVQAENWLGDKVGQVGHGVSSFAHDLDHSNSLGGAIDTIGTGLHDADSWFAKTGGEAWRGLKQFGQEQKGLGVGGVLGEVAGIGNAVVAGAGHLAEEGWSGLKSAGSSLWSWLAD